MLDKMKCTPNKVLIWSDEKIFTMEAVMHVMQEICPKVAGVIYAVRSQLHAWCGLQLHLMGLSLP